MVRSLRNPLLLVSMCLVVIFGAGLVVWPDPVEDRDGEDRPLAAGERNARTGTARVLSGDLVDSDIDGAAGSVDREEVEPLLSREQRWRKRIESLPTGFVTGCCVDDRGRPLEGATVSGFYLVQEASSAADGTFKVEARIPYSHVDDTTLKFHKPGYAHDLESTKIVKDRTVCMEEIVLRPAGSLSGIVVDESSRPVAGARIDLCDSEGRTSWRLNWSCELYPGQHSPQTDGDGCFRLRGIPAGILRVKAVRDGFSGALSPPRKVCAGVETGALRIVLAELPPPVHIEGVVLTADGEPVEGADVAYGYAPLESFDEEGSVPSDEEGRFRIVVERTRLHHLMVFGTGQGPSPATARNVAPGTTDIVMQFLPARAGRIDVRSSTDGRLMYFEVNLYEFDRQPRYHGEEFSGDEIPDDGPVELLLPSRPFMARVEGNGHLPATLGPFDPQTFPDPLRITLEPAPGISGVVTIEGRAPGGLCCKISVHEAEDRPGIEFRVNDFLARSQQYEMTHEIARSDGAFRIPLTESERIYLRVFASGYAPAEAGPFDFDHLKGLRGLVVNLTRGGVLEGRLILPRGEAVEGRLVAVSRGDGFSRTARTGPDGSYRFERLVPGPYEVGTCRNDLDEEDEFGTGSMHQDFTRTDTAARYDWACTVKEGATTRFDLDLSRDADRWVDGTVLFDGSLSPAGWKTSLKRKRIAQREGSYHTVSECELAGDGWFRLESSHGGSHWIFITGPGGREDRLEIIAPISLTAGGTTSWNLNLSFGRLSGRIASDRASGREEWYRYTWVGQQGTRGSVPLKRDGDGFFELDPVPAGRGSVIRMREPVYRSWDPEEEVLARVEVIAGETVELRID
jgi:hypothetical protein